MRISSITKGTLAFATLAIFLLIVPAAWGHGGHGKPELQFHLAPASAGDEDATVIRMGDAAVPRGEFVTYLQNVAAFQMKADLLQRDFLLHFWIIEGLSRYYPSDINELFARLVQMDPGSPEYDAKLDEWILAQADLYARIDHYYRKALASGADKDPAARAVLDCFAVHAKADFLEDLVSYGSMRPDPDGVREFAAGLAEGEVVEVGTHYKDPADAAPFERKRARTRWIGYRRDVLAEAKTSRRYKKVETLDVPPETVVARVGDREITLGDFLAIYGPVPNDVNWNQVKMSRGAQLVRAYALAAEADRLGIVPPAVRAKLEMAERFYLAAGQIVREMGPAFFERPDAVVDFQFYRDVVYYPSLVKFEKYFLAESEKIPARGSLWVDEAGLRGIRWKLEPAYTPEQAKYF